MPTYNVFQVEISDARYHEVNAKGWEGVDWGLPYTRLTCFLSADDPKLAAKVADGIKHDLYKNTCKITAAGPESAFAVGNSYGTGEIKDFCRHKSLSVGDVLVTEDDEAFIVCAFGFAPVEFDFFGG